MTLTRRRFHADRLCWGRRPRDAAAVVVRRACDEQAADAVHLHASRQRLVSARDGPARRSRKSCRRRKQKKVAFEVDLDRHELPAWLSPLTAHKANLTLLQGLSGKMCTTGHHSWCSSLGVFKANERISSIRRATVDFELAKLFPSPMEHIELACFPLDGGNPRGSLDGIAQGFSAAARSNPTTRSVRRRSPCGNCSSRCRPNQTSRSDINSNARCWSSSPATKRPRRRPRRYRATQDQELRRRRGRGARSQLQKVDLMKEVLRQAHAAVGGKVS